MEREQDAPGAPDHELASSTWTEVADGPSRLLLVPVGSCEQHGPHLPFDTDTRIAQAVVRLVAARRADVVVAPPVTFGASGEHQSFPGTLSIGTEVLTTLVVELGRSAFPPDASPYRGLVFANGHGGNLWAVRRAVEVLREEGRPVTWWAAAPPEGDAHAGRTETSLLLAIAPEVVRSARPVGNTAPVAELLDAMRAGGVGAISDSGVLGDSVGASAEEGRQLLGALVESLSARLDEPFEVS